jgi:phosphoglycerol transferase MdoB-like AlkP superfamily enzyme
MRKKGMGKDIFVLITLTIVSILIFILSIGKSPIDIQLHDTYFVLSTTEIIFLIIGPLTFLLFFLLGLARKFKTKWTNIGLMFGLIIVSFIIFRVVVLQISYRNQVHNKLLTMPMLTKDRKQISDRINAEIKLTCGLFGICLIGIGVIGYRTYKLSSMQID